jgi:chaperonin GroES
MNTSGFEPLDLRVLVLPDEVKTKIGAIHLPDSVVEQDKWAQTKATVIAVGDNAWEEARARAPGFMPPQPGDRVLFGKYSGQRLKGDDGKDYVIMNDEDVLARLKEA